VRVGLVELIRQLGFAEWLNELLAACWAEAAGELLIHDGEVLSRVGHMLYC
jgi:hypothetical protein